MPELTLILDVDEVGFELLGDMESAAVGVKEGKVIHLSNDAQVEIGTLRDATVGGKDGVMICFALPDGKIVVLETTAALFLGAAEAITGWQKGRADRGEA